MKKTVQSPGSKQLLAKALLSTTLIAVFAVGCTKSRDPELKDEELIGEIFAKADLQGREYSIQTGSTADSSLDNGKKMVAGNEKASVQITATNAPAKLAGVFKGLAVQASQGASYNVKLILDKNAMHVLKVVKDDSELSTIEKQARLVEKGKGSLVPLFNVKVADYGRLCQLKDDNGDLTTRLSLCQTDFEAATHVRLSVIRNDRAGYFKSDEMKEIFLANRIDGQVSTLADIKEQLNISLQPVEDVKVVSYVAPGKGSQVEILIYKLLKKSEITDEKLLQKLNSPIKTGEISYCTDEVKKSLSKEEAKDCVMVLSYTVDAKAVQAEVKTKDDFGDPTLSVNFKGSEAGKNLSLIQVAAQTPVTTIRAREVGQLNPYNTIRVMDLKGKEFLLRRTFEDSASPIQVFGPGASGPIDIVKFEFEDKRIVVRRATAVNGDKNPAAIDREEMMSIPVQYFAIDPSTASSRNPKLIESTKETAQYIVLDWTNNTLPALNSPLSYFENGQCFMASGSQAVTDLDNRIVEGTLNFSITGSYSFRPDCMSWYNLNDYWYGGNMQAAFNIKERVSFKLHKGELDTKGLDLPFRAQTMLGFGVFTAGKLVPDQFGNNGKVDNELSRPVIHDFSNGQQLVYHLGGLPESGWMRDKLIEGTKEVIQEWNESLRKSFAGTALARSGDYVVLKIDGIDAEPGKLGDLDRNYIWNFEKNLDSGLLGMSQAGPNPRSGRIEQNNILMYGGNLLSNIGSFKEMARRQKEYEDLKAKVLADAFQAEAPDLSSPVDPNDPNGGLLIENGRRLVERINAIASVIRPQTPALRILKPSAAAKVTTNVTSRVKAQIQSLSRGNDLSSQKTQVMNAQTNKMAYLEKIFRKAVEMNLTHDEAGLNALTAAEVLRAYGRDLKPEQRDALAAQSRRLALMAEFQKNFRKGPNCALNASPYLNAGAADPDLLDDSKTPEVFKSWYKSTLLHEMGHSLGLTHNFKGSVDAPNFAFQSEKKSEKSRNYSSIMDYIPDTYLNYQGPGPYDVRALRVAYTGMIELAPSAVNQLQGKVTIHNVSKEFPNEITLSDFKKLVLGDQKSWWDLDASYRSKVPLKDYNFCTDIHVGYEPSCNRWDLGTNDAEIAKFYSDEYKGLYPVLNARGSRINIRGVNSYLSRIMGQFFSLRPFLEETYLKLMTGQDFQSTLQAAITAHNLFIEIVNSPTATLPFSSPARFHVVPMQDYDDQGQPIQGKTFNTLVETKAAQDIAVPGGDFQVDTRGIELDKAFAMMMLTQKDMPNPRYDAYSIRVSFADLEAAMGSEPSQNLTLVTLANILADQPMALTQTKHGLQPLPANFQAEVTSMVRYYAGLSASVFLDADTIEDKHNFATLFRMASSQKSVPKDRFAVTKLDQDLSSPGSLKLWSLDNAVLAEGLVKTMAQKRVYLDNADKLSKLMAQGYLALQANNQAELSKAREEFAKVILGLNKRNILIPEEELKGGLNPQMHYDSALKFMAAQVQSAQEVIDDLRKSGLTDQQIPQVAQRVTQTMAAETEAVSKQLPLFAIAQKALLTIAPAESPSPELALLGQVLASYLNNQVLEANYGLVVNNLQFLNQILTALHPELNRY